MKLAAALASLMLLTACGGAASSSPAASGSAAGASAGSSNSKINSWYQEARKEGEVVWGTNTPDAYRALIDPFQKQYPGVKLTLTQADGATIADRMTLEAQNKRVSIDINHSGFNQSTVLISRDLLTTYDFSGTPVDPNSIRWATASWPWPTPSWAGPTTASWWPTKTSRASGRTCSIPSGRARSPSCPPAPSSTCC
jgi:hypothetical protein